MSRSELRWEVVIGCGGHPRMLFVDLEDAQAAQFQLAEDHADPVRVVPVRDGEVAPVQGDLLQPDFFQHHQ